MIHFTCTCGNVLFFENSVCLKCGTEVGYDVESNRMMPLGQQTGLTRCKNGADYGVCNWVVPFGGANAMCPSCELNRTIPDLHIPANVEAWHKMESAKRRVLYTLRRLGLRPVSRNVSPAGVIFDMICPTASEPVMTGHLDGVITLNLLEANDSYRESIRTNFGEPYRTLVGHFQHEFGHYYWDRFFKGRAPNDPVMRTWRELFGDECIDYGTALQAYHTQGPPSAWNDTHITAYAACHPWEDWAETWAQYLHILDGTETAESFGWTSDQVPIPVTPFSSEIANDHLHEDLDFLETLTGWVKLAPALNEIAASLGHPNLYPFVLSRVAVRKIYFVHEMVREATRANRPDGERAAKTDDPPEQSLAAA